MTRPYSNDLRERAMARVAAGETTRGSGGIADQPSCVFKMVGDACARPACGVCGQMAATEPRVLSGAHAGLAAGPGVVRYLRCGDWRRSLPSAA